MKKAILILITGAIAFTMSCSTDLDVTGDYEDYTVVYGLLSKDDSIHKFKITKAFLGEANAYDMAAVADSSYYKYDEIEASLEEWSNGNLITTIKLDTGFVNDKEEGVFYAPKQMVYENKTPFHLNSASDYRLVVQNSKLNKTVSTTLNVVSNRYGISSPYQNEQATLDMTRENGKIEWTAFDNGVVYYTKIRFNYVDVKDGDSTEQHFYWTIGSKVDEDGYEISMNYSPNEIYSILAERIPVDESIVRLPGKKNKREEQFEYIVTAFDRYYYTYKELSSNDDDIFSVRPEYSNIDNGLGLVYSKQTISAKYQFSIDAMTELINGAGTKPLNFKNW